MKVVQARAPEIQRLQKALEPAGIKLGSVLSGITGAPGRLMAGALIDGERRAWVLADLAKGTLRPAGKQADLPMALAARFTDHHAMLCRLHRDQIKLHDHAIAGLDEIGPEPHRWFPSHGKLACRVTVCPGNNISARKRKSGRTGEAGTCIKPVLAQAAWAAIRVRGRLQARYRRLVRRLGGDKNPGAKKKAVIAIARTLLKLACQVLMTGQPYDDLGADSCTRRESPEQQHAYLERRLQKPRPGCTITITVSPPPGDPPLSAPAEAG